MKLAGKLARKFREFFTSDFPFIGQLKQKILKEMKTKAKQGRAGIYVPNYYWIGLPEDSSSGIDQELKGELQDVIKDKIEDYNYKLYNNLQFKFETGKQEVMVTGKFKVRATQTDNKQENKDKGTKVFSKESQKKEKTNSQVATIRLDTKSPKQACLKLKQDNKEKTFPLEAVETNIGRQESNEVTLLDRSVSRVHAQIINKKYYYLIRDLDSTNGVQVNGEFVKQRQLVDGDKISLGEIKLEFRQQEKNEK